MLQEDEIRAVEKKIKSKKEITWHKSTGCDSEIVILNSQVSHSGDTETNSNRTNETCHHLTSHTPAMLIKCDRLLSQPLEWDLVQRSDQNSES